MLKRKARPRSGLALDDALKRWSDVAAYAELVQLAGQNDLPVTSLVHLCVREPERRREYCQKREALEAAFHVKLIERSILVSAIAEYSNRREIIEPSLWESLEILYNVDGGAFGLGRRYEHLEFFESSEIPLNVQSLAEWLVDDDTASSEHNELAHDPSYQHVELGSQRFSFGPKQGQVVKLLHEAAQSSAPWRNGKDLLEQAGSMQIKMHDFFKSSLNWKSLIESDGRGHYRLRVKNSAAK